MTAFVVVNPRSANGRTGRDWQSIESKLRAIYPHMSAVFTKQRGQATALVRAEHGDLPSVEHLAHMYGTRLNEMLAEANNRPELRAPVGSAGDIGAQVLFAVREEMALTLADVVMRRT
ncbi:MAG: hypothetical protein JO346_00005, partial [Alphaproteobacteria bacterium]|nr:hypothetical protein [Alphaproteobacteria bacterium]